MDERGLALRPLLLPSLFQKPLGDGPANRLIFRLRSRDSYAFQKDLVLQGEGVLSVIGWLGYNR